METCFNKEGVILECGDSIIDSTLKYIKEHYCEDINVGVLAELSGLSHGHFAKRFKSMVGLNPIDYMIDLRLRKAQKLLRETNLTLAQIAVRCGYKNEYYLSRMFTKKVKIRPTIYRLNHRI